MADYKYNKLDDEDTKLESFKSLVNSLGQDKALSFAQDNSNNIPSWHPTEMDIFSESMRRESLNFSTEKNTPKDYKDETLTENQLITYSASVLAAIKKYISGTITRLTIENNTTDLPSVKTMFDEFSLVTLSKGSKTDKVGYIKKVKTQLEKTDDNLYTITNTTTMKDALLEAIENFTTTANTKKNKKREFSKKNSSASNVLKETILGYLGSLESLRNGFSRNDKDSLVKRRKMNAIIRSTNTIIKSFKGPNNNTDSTDTKK